MALSSVNQLMHSKMTELTRGQSARLLNNAPVRRGKCTLRAPRCNLHGVYIARVAAPTSRHKVALGATEGPAEAERKLRG